jgi:hypothetical protein
MNALGKLAASLSAWALAAGAACACDDPVYLHALENWPRRPYQVLQYGGTEPAAPGSALSRLAAQGQANVAFSLVDVARLDRLPVDAPVRRAWEERQQASLPFYVVLAPDGSQLYSGPMTAEETGPLARSPQRAKLAKLLSAGKEGALVLLTGRDADATSRAKRTLESALEQAEAAGHDVGCMVVDRTDPEEVWLVRQLLAVHGDQPGLDEPMLFGAFGKAHVMVPHVGAGITSEAIARLIRFLKGPCACDEVACAQGVDLLTDYDWAKYSSHEPAADERPYYSLLAPKYNQPPESPPRPPLFAQIGLVRNTAIAIIGVAAVALIAGYLILSRSHRRARE